MRAVWAAGVFGAAVLLGAWVFRRVAVKIVVSSENTESSVSGSEPPMDESRGTDQSTP